MKAKRLEGGLIRFWCPACDTAHTISAGWAFNDDFERPTFSPSVLVRSGHYMDGHSGSCWCTFNAEHPNNPAPFKCYRCHSFVTDGIVDFLNDCTHELAGQKIPLPDLESMMEDA